MSKYNIHDPTLPARAGYVLVVDQTAGDASVRASGATQATFDEMLAMPARRIPARHPDQDPSRNRRRPAPRPLWPRPRHPGVSLVTDALSPWALLDGAIAVYTVSSQMGFEAIMAGHRPHVWGQPFYAGWGLTHDRTPPPRPAGRTLTRNQLFAAAMILAPTWYDPCRDRLCAFEDALDLLEAEVRAFRQTARAMSPVACGRGSATACKPCSAGQATDLQGRSAAAAAMAARTGRGLLVWAGKEPEGFAAPCLRVEDGFLRSRGLGAELVPPLSLVADDLGIYYDPTRPHGWKRCCWRRCPPAAAPGPSVCCRP